MSNSKLQSQDAYPYNQACAANTWSLLPGLTCCLARQALLSCEAASLTAFPMWTQPGDGLLGVDQSCLSSLQMLIMANTC